MKIKLPLYAKILFWFFLNLVFLGVVFLVIARVQFRFGLDSLIAGPGGQNLENAIQLMTAELRDNSQDRWDSVLTHFDETYHVRFYLFRGWDQVAGLTVNLPQAVHDKMPNHPPGGNRPPLRREDEGPNLRPPRGDEGGPNPRPGFGPPERFNPEVAGQQERPPQKSMVHTSAPGRYWVIAPIVLPDKQRPMGPNPDQRRMVPMTLVVASDSLGAGGLFFNVTPWIIGGIAVVLLSVMFWIPPVRGITRAISKMTRATEKIADGQFDVRSQVNRQDELGTLSDSINQMAMRLSGFVTGQKRFLGDIAHELCSPIARIQVALGILEQRADKAQAENLQDLREEVEQISGLVNELLSFSKASLAKAAIKVKPISVWKLVDKTVSRECGGADDVKVKVDVPEDLQAMADPDLCLRAVGNILRNAIRYAAKAGPITISARREADAVMVAIEDCGPGIPEEAIPQIFDPFFRVDTSRDRETGGVGLGLAIVKTCIESCGGTVSCENRAPSGLRVTIRLPAA
jgi:two-component system, OmpR family, sensor histidine kinase CpxA